MPACTCTGYTYFLQLNRWPMFHLFAGPRECRSSSNAAHEGGDGTGLVRCHPRSQRAQHHARLADIHRVRHIPQCPSAATCRAPVVLQSFGDKKRFEEKALPPLSCGIRAEACAAIAATYIGKLEGLLRQVDDHSKFGPIAWLPRHRMGLVQCIVSPVSVDRSSLKPIHPRVQKRSWSSLMRTGSS